MSVLVAILQAIADGAYAFVNAITWVVWCVVQAVISFLDFDPFLPVINELDPAPLGDAWTNAIGFVLHWVPVEFAFRLIVLAVGIVGFAVLFKSLYSYIKLRVH